MSDNIVREPYGVTTFCEDIRQEVSGALTFVGVLPPEIGVPVAPFLFPKFSIFTSIVLPPVPKEQSVLKARLEMFLPGLESDASFKLDVESPVVTSSVSQLDPDIPQHSKLWMRFTVSPLEIASHGFIKVRATVEGKLIRAGVLRIVPQSNLQQVATQGRAEITTPNQARLT